MYLPSGKMILPNFWLVTPILEPPMSTTRWNNMSSRGSLMVCRTVFFEKNYEYSTRNDYDLPGMYCIQNYFQYIAFLFTQVYTF